MRLKLTLLILISCLSFSTSIFSQDSLPNWERYLLNYDLDSVVVTGQLVPTDSKNAIYPVRVIDRKTIEMRGANDLGTLLRQELSISLEEDEFLGTSFSLLGTDGENVKILIDGVPIVGRRGGNVDIRQINLNNIQRVEIIEGPVSALYGNNALGGVINLISKRSQLSPYEFDQQIRGESVGIFNMNMRAGARFDKTFVQVTAGRDNFDGIYEDSLPKVELYWDPKLQYRAGLLARHDFNEEMTLQYSFGYFHERIKDFGTIRRQNFNPYSNNDYYYTQRVDNSVTLKGKISDNYYLDATVAINQYKRRHLAVQYFFEPDTFKVKPPLFQDTSKIRSFFNRIAFVSQFGSKLDFGVITEINSEAVRGGKLEAEAKKPNGFLSISSYSLTGVGTYKPLKKLTIQPTIRFTLNSSYKAPISPSLLVKYQVSKPLTLRATYARGFRSPGLEELYFNFKDGNHNIVGNRFLKAETSNSFLTHVKYQKDLKRGHRVGFSLSNSFNKFKNKIDLIEVKPDLGEMGPKFMYKNFTDTVSIVMGLTMEYGFKNLTFNTGFSTTWISNYASDEAPELPKFSRVAYTNQSASYFWDWSKVNFSIFHKNHFKRTWYYQEEGEALQGYIKGYGLVDFSANRRFWKNRLSLTLGIHNIFNIKRVESEGPTAFHTSDEGFTDVSKGRRFFGQIGLHWTAGKE